jgi:hypothetical protein
MGSTYHLGESLGYVGKRNTARSLGPEDVDIPEAPGDAGCECSPSCLSCPLPMCKHDNPTWYMRQVRDKFDPQIIETFESFWGLPPEEAVARTARAMNITAKLVWRALKRESQRASPPSHHHERQLVGLRS